MQPNSPDGLDIYDYSQDPETEEERLDREELDLEHRLLTATEEGQLLAIADYYDEVAQCSHSKE